MSNMYRVVPKYTYSYKTYHIICFKKLVIVLVYKCLTVVIKTGQKKKKVPLLKAKEWFTQASDTLAI